MKLEDIQIKQILKENIYLNIKGKILINTDQIRCISVYDFNWKDKENYIVDYDSIKYCVYFDKDRYVYTDIESYEKIKKLIITSKEPLYEKV